MPSERGPTELPRPFCHVRTQRTDTKPAGTTASDLSLQGWEKCAPALASAPAAGTGREGVPPLPQGSGACDFKLVGKKHQKRTETPNMVPR